jgi:hypothetical protein
MAFKIGPKADRAHRVCSEKHAVSHSSSVAT